MATYIEIKANRWDMWSLGNVLGTVQKVVESVRGRALLDEADHKGQALMAFYFYLTSCLLDAE